MKRKVQGAIVIWAAAWSVFAGHGQPTNGRPVDDVLRDYANAAGGLAAVEGIQTREVQTKQRRQKYTYYWEKPDKVLRLYKKEKIGYEDGSGWVLSNKKKLSRTTGNLDSKSGAGVVALLHQLALEGSTLVLITHDANIAASFPRQIHMRDGEIVGDERA